MNSLRNKVSLIGRLGQEPTLQTVGDNRQLAKFALATNENYKDKTGKWVDNTQWHNVVAWGKSAERLVKLVAKGQEVMLEGRIVNRSYEKEGEKRFATDIEMTDFLLLSPRNADKAESTSDKHVK